MENLILIGVGVALMLLARYLLLPIIDAWYYYKERNLDWQADELLKFYWLQITIYVCFLFLGIFLVVSGVVY